MINSITSNLTQHPREIIKRFLVGAAIAFLLITLLVFSVDTSDPAWPPNWRIRPLIVTPIIAGLGACFSILLDPVRKQGGMKAVLAILLSLMVFVFSLWIGSILGLNGTLWN